MVHRTSKRLFRSLGGKRRRKSQSFRVRLTGKQKKEGEEAGAAAFLLA
jgi:hypothetical protein